jgi:uncharacterized membrane protein
MSPVLQRVIHRNIGALLEARRAQEERLGLTQRFADAVTSFTGSMGCVYLHAAFFAGWLLWNVGVLGVKPFDPFPFVMLAMIASVEAIFLSTFVLMTQNRMSRLADQRADLNLQISLLAEHEITRLIRVIDAMAHRIGVPAEELENVDELKKDVAPEVVLQEIERAENS